MVDVPDEADVVQTPFVFVGQGEPEPVEWLAAHPGWVKFPATLLPRAAAGPDRGAAPTEDRTEDRGRGMSWAFSRRPIPPVP
jgi:hypothetical protein